MQLLLGEDFMSINHLVVVVVDAIVDAYKAVADCEQEAGVANGSELLDSLAEWAYAALAFVDGPFADDIQYQLQRLRRTCQNAIVGAHNRNEIRGSNRHIK